LTSRRYTRELAEFSVGLALEDVPADVISKVKLHMIDQLGIEIGCANVETPANRAIRRYAMDFGTEGGCVVFGTKRRLRAEYAALVNATTGHGFEFDDYHPAPGHPGCVAVPATLAVAQEGQASGAEVLAATVVAFEVIVRIALAGMPSMIRGRGFHATCAQGVFGAAAAAARLRGFDGNQLEGVFGIAASHASGTVEYTQSGGDIKRYHAGLGASGGIRAAELAALGMTAPTGILEGSRGFLQAFSEDPRPDRIVEGLGERWHLLDTALKPYACCGSSIAHIDAFRTAQNDHGFAWEDIDEVRVGTDRLSLLQVDRIGPEPKDLIGAQFSTQYGIGMSAVIGSNGLQDYLSMAAASFRDARVLGVARRVHLELDPEVDRLWDSRWIARVCVQLKSGREITAESAPKGSMWNPMRREEVEAKFRTIASREVSRDMCDRLLHFVNNVESFAEVDPLFQYAESGI